MSWVQCGNRDAAGKAREGRGCVSLDWRHHTTEHTEPYETGVRQRFVF